MSKNTPVYFFLVAFVAIIAALVFNVMADYADTAEHGRLFRHLSTISIVLGIGLLIVNKAKE